MYIIHSNVHNLSFPHEVNVFPLPGVVPECPGKMATNECPGRGQSGGRAAGRGRGPQGRGGLPRGVRLDQHDIVLLKPQTMT